MGASSVLSLTHDGDVCIARLCRGRGNALDPTTLRALADLFASGGVAERPPVVLTASGRSFCTGLDLEYALAQDRSGMRALMEQFHGTLRSCFAYPGPVIAAIGGHALAGGALLAAACDVRLMAQGSGRFGVHGAQLGIAYPHVAVELVRYQYGRAVAEEVLYHGALQAAEDAARSGRVDDLVEAGSLEDLAIERARALCSSSSRAFAHQKLVAREATLDRIDRLGREGEERWIDLWLHPGTRDRIRASRARSSARSQEDPPS